MDGFEEDVDLDLPELEVEEVEEDNESLARRYIQAFFADKEMHYGGPIPRHYLSLPKFVEMVMNTEICSGIDECYYRLGKTEMLDDEEDNHISDDVRMIIDILAMCAKAGVPKEFASGMTLMYLELCKGVRSPVYKIII